MIRALSASYQTGVRACRGLRDFCLEAARSSEVHKLAIEFCTEVAVLIAVFPILDTLIPVGGTAQGKQPALWGRVFTFEGVAAIFFLLAVIIVVWGRRE